MMAELDLFGAAEFAEISRPNLRNDRTVNGAAARDAMRLILCLFGDRTM
jgi:hypothetical protein